MIVLKWIFCGILFVTMLPFCILGQAARYIYEAFMLGWDHVKEMGQ